MELANSLVAILLLQLLPGLALLTLLWHNSPLSVGERFALALGIGVALPPLLLEATRLLGIPWATGATVAYILLSSAVLAVHFIRAMRLKRHWLLPTSADIVLGVLFIGGLGVRLYMVRDLPAGMWGDSYHHTVITQLLIEHQGLFTSWAPYAPLVTMTYHYGFHANAAFLHWVSVLPSTEAVILTGQTLNALTIPLAYLMTMRLMRGSAYARVAGLLAALFTGFVNTQPVYFVNWGRYTQLAGQVVLPVVVVCWVEMSETAVASHSIRAVARIALLTALITACLMLTHYVVTIFAALFVGAFLTIFFLTNRGLRQWLVLALGSVVTAAGAVLLALPWLIDTLAGKLRSNAMSFVSGAAGAQRIEDSSTLFWPAPFFIKESLLALAALGLICAMWRRDLRVLLYAVWTALLFLSVRPQLLHLPGAGVIEAFAAYLALYVTLTPLAAYPLALSYVRRDLVLRRVETAFRFRFPQTKARFLPVAAVMLILGVMTWGIAWQKDALDLNFQLLTNADWSAMQWIRLNTPADARFLVNSFPAYNGTLIAGSDGGWWLPFLTGRQSNLPPLTYGSEKSSDSTLYARTNQLAVALRGRPLTDSTSVAIDLTTPQSMAVLAAAGIHYVYLGAHANPAPGNADYIAGSPLALSTAFHLIYEHDNVKIFRIDY